MTMKGKRHLLQPAAAGVMAVILLLAGHVGMGWAASDTVTVFAAASTTNAITEVGAIFAKGNKERFRTSFASSSTLAKQIEKGALADVHMDIGCPLLARVTSQARHNLALAPGKPVYALVQGASVSRGHRGSPNERAVCKMRQSKRKANHPRPGLLQAPGR